ncbi:endonuclease/exonuclease/phosphatase family protein [Robertkochia solimangrovi]|uniref:endonuclease/exonuclease/phosphatase family protein n=1 Tax=Robertkochia solimangrovi TaxID=2213046 RepID=UPI00117F0298|nr:endonuclease/exonuclease/phosphatase family protein [Robertkochia solimangrovi]TRZ45838.1 endonuclease/exonuclease/phosphatase family protein [Robertkochia solimangrovi]
MKYILILLTLMSISVSAQMDKYQLVLIAFYNAENLFDTSRDTLILDNARTPGGRYQWTEERYQKKLRNLAKVLANIGAAPYLRMPDIIGLAEIENRKVLEDLITTGSLQRYPLGILHINSPDERGIDTAIIYNRDTFIPVSVKAHPLRIYSEEGFRDYTRDLFLVSGYLKGELVYIMVNHWPSRGGGKRSVFNREIAARQVKRKTDSILYRNSAAKIIIMGDFNDNPTDHSIKDIMKTSGNRQTISKGQLFNTTEKLYKSGLGTHAYRDEWNCFDQFMISQGLLNNSKGYRYWRSGIFNPAFLRQKKGRYKGYPFRTYSGLNYTGGYSDHFPVYLYLIQQIN